MKKARVMYIKPVDFSSIGIYFGLINPKNRTDIATKNVPKTLNQKKLIWGRLSKKKSLVKFPGALSAYPIAKELNTAANKAKTIPMINDFLYLLLLNSFLYSELSLFLFILAKINILNK